MVKPFIPKESFEQEQFFSWLRKNYPGYAQVCWSSVNGAMLANGDISWTKLEKQGAKKGVPDIFFALPFDRYHGLFIEMKRTKGGKVSPEQERLIACLRLLGYRIEITEGCEEAKIAFIKYIEGVAGT